MPGLFIVDLLGTEMSAEEKTILQHPEVGGLILFTRNFINPDQLQRLIATVRTLRSDIFIAVDHEGGVVQRFQRHGFRILPAARVYGDVFNLHAETGLALARQYGELMATDLQRCGVDLSLAPVLDIHGASQVIAQLDRAFHENPEVVTQLAEAFIQGMHAAGMPAIGKHFPGHGSVLSDSHIAMPVCTASKDELINHDLKPFIQLIEKNLLNAVMPAHVTYPAVDANRPAGFSKIWLQDILRQKLQFQGLVMSDCLGMIGADIGSLPTRATQAAKAGCDMLIVCNQTRDVLKQLITSITIKQSDLSLNRIEAFKRSMLRFSGKNQKMVTSDIRFGQSHIPIQHHHSINNTKSV